MYVVWSSLQHGVRAWASFQQGGQTSNMVADFQEEGDRSCHYYSDLGSEVPECLCHHKLLAKENHRTAQIQGEGKWTPLLQHAHMGVGELLGDFSGGHLPHASN